ncbi:MAG: anti-sigma factor antagonist [Chlamydiota bacterium]|nr:anti-sigma factor antagonist [Chlamydiota bacterium]
MGVELDFPEEEFGEALAYQTGSVLIVDDDPLVLMALEQTIKKEGHDIITAQNGEEAVKILREKVIAVILCDQRMPNMTGTEVMQHAIELQPDAVRIILTGNSDEKTAIEAINKGNVSQFLIKPWDDNQLRQALQNGIEQYKLIQQNRSLQALLLEKHKALASSHASLRRDLQLGAMIHETLLLGSVPKSIDGVLMDATTIPSEEIDGDFYDFYNPAPGILDVVIGDVMGKGIPAAVVGTAVKTQLIRFATPVSKSKIYDKLNAWKEDLLTPWQILSKVHKEIAEKLIRLEYFVCLFYARFNFDKRTFSFVDCGSAKPIHYQYKKKKSRVLKGQNFPLGMVEKDTYEDKKIQFDECDFFVFYSDGVTESRSPSGELYGPSRLQEIIEKNADLSATDLVNVIKKSVVEFAEKSHFDDDLTLIVVKVDENIPNHSAKLMQARFSSDLSQLKAVRDFVDKACKKTPGNAELLANELQLVVDEAFVNIVEHSYKNNPKATIIIQVSYNENGIVFELSDQGPSFDPSEVIEPSLAGDRDGGFGWHIIRSVADQIAYVSKQNEDGWNHLRIYKQYHFGEEVMEIFHKEEEDTLIVTLESETLDAKDAPDFKQKVIDLITANNLRNLIFDLRNLKFIDSSGLGSFLAVLRVVNSQSGDLKLANMSKTVRTMFELVSMHKIFEIYATTEDALKSVSSKNSEAIKS